RVADAPAQGALGRAVLSRGRPPADEGERARDRGHAPEPRGARAPGAVPRGPVPSPERDPAAPAATTRARRGHSAAGAAFHAEERARAGRRTEAAERRGDARAAGVRVAGQRPPARERLPL